VGWISRTVTGLGTQNYEKEFVFHCGVHEV